MSTRPPKLLLFVENTTSFQHVVRSRILEEGSRTGKFDFCVVLPPGLSPSEADLARLHGVKFLPLDIHHAPTSDFLGRVLKKPIHILSRDLLTVMSPDATLAQDRAFGLKKRGSSIAIRLAYARLLNKFGVSWRHLSQFAQHFGRYPEIGKLLDDYQPDLVVYFNILMGQLDCLREVKRRNIPLVLDLPNWDQASSKGPLTVLPDHAFVWSKQVGADFCRIHDFPEEQTTPIGVAQFDAYAQKDDVLSRDEFCRIHGIDPSKKIVLYAYGQPPGIKACDPFVRDILECIAPDKIGTRCHLIFRASPRVPFPETLRELGGVTVQHPLGHETAGGLGWMPSPEEDRMRKSTLAHSDVIINIFSTMCLDGLAMDRPVINLGYVCGDPENAPNRMERFFTYTHVIPVMESNGTWIVKTKKELQTAIQEALSEPTAKLNDGRTLLHQICGPSDGKTFQRWLEAMSCVVEKHCQL